MKCYNDDDDDDRLECVLFSNKFSFQINVLEQELQRRSHELNWRNSIEVNNLMNAFVNHYVVRLENISRMEMKS